MVKKRISKKIITLVQDYAHFLADEGLKIDKVFIFGSYAKGEQHKDSDIDVCILSNQFSNSYEALRFLSIKSMVNKRYHDIEGHGFTSKYFNEHKFSPLVCEIKRHGIQVL